MSGRLFWAVTAVVAAIAAHLATILFLPSLMFERNLAQMTRGARANSVVMLAPAAVASLIPSATAGDVAAICLIDLAQGKVVIKPHVPQGYWSFAIFNKNGQQVYGLNDVEAGQSGFAVELSQAKSILQQIRGTGETEDAATIANIGWHAQVTGTRALAVLWAPVPDEARRHEIETAMQGTECGG